MLATAALLLVFWFSASAHASCAPPPPIDRAIDDAQAVFVGTVTDLQYDGRVATFRVEEVWKGDVAATTLVSGGPKVSELEAAHAQGGDVVTSVDRHYEQGTRYLVVSYGSDGDALLDTECSATRPFTSDLDPYRPASAGEPVASVDPIVEADTRPAPPLGALTAVAVVAVVAAAMAVRARRRRHRSGAVTP